MCKFGFTLIDICNKIHSIYTDVHAIPSSMDEMFIDIFLDPDVVLNITESKSGPEFMTDENVVIYCLRDIIDPLASNTNDKRQKYYLGNLTMNKIDGISDIVIRNETLDEANFGKEIQEYKKWERVEHYLDLLIDDEENFNERMKYYETKVHQIVKTQSIVRNYLHRQICQRRVEKREPTKMHWLINTVGSNLRAVMNLPMVDHRRTYSDDPWEVLSVLGIEATRSLLVVLYRKLLSESYILPTHIDTLVSYMDHFGSMVAVSRNGIDSREAMALAKASFEESSSNLHLSALNADRDTLKGTSACIHLGKRGKFGTGVIDIFSSADKPDTIETMNDGVTDDWGNSAGGSNIFEGGWGANLSQKKIETSISAPKPPSKKPQKLHSEKM